MGAQLVGFAFICDGSRYGASAACVDLFSHACDWLLTVDCLTAFRDGLTQAQAARVADAGYRGDDIRKARRVLATLPACQHDADALKLGRILRAAAYRNADSEDAQLAAAEALPSDYLPPCDCATCAPPATLGERLMPGCTCGAAESGDFQRCRCD
jgi:hypothetical protein